MNTSLEEYHQMTRSNQGRRNRQKTRIIRNRNKKQSQNLTYNVDNRRRLHITSLDLSFNNNDLRKLFEEFGILKRCGIHYDQMGNSKGTADVEYESHEATERALVKLNQEEINGIKLIVTYSNTTTSYNKYNRRAIGHRSTLRKLFKKNQSRRLFRRRKPMNSNSNRNDIVRRQRWNITYHNHNTPKRVTSFGQRRFKKIMSRRH